ncbi:MAG: NAD(P)H-dependent oxidoreductase [Bdellovibrionales bacterium]|nr:NAD(P)H-dependent oxidoreductase [Bdellovibrionales bacterium]
MIKIIAGTNRAGSRSLELANIIHNIYSRLNQKSEVFDLAKLPLSELEPTHYTGEKPANIQLALDEIMQAEGLVIVCPEYNGSMPGALKYFIDHWKYPEAFEHRPVCFVGLGGRFGGVRPVEHLQQVFGYRNSFIYPDRVFLMNVWGILKEGKIQDELIMDLLEKQAQGFCRFIKALKSENLSAGDATT